MKIMKYCTNSNELVGIIKPFVLVQKKCPMPTFNIFSMKGSLRYDRLRTGRVGWVCLGWYGVGLNRTEGGREAGR